MKLTVEEIAQVAHEANRSYCLAIGDKTQKHWIDAPDWQRESYIKGVNYHIENPNSTPADSHESWLKEKIDQGWKYGLVKDAENKEHPCCVLYELLPTEQQAKDYIFLAIAKTLAKI